MSLAEFLAACHEATDAGFLFVDSAPEPGAVAAVRRFAGNGHRVHIITDRSFGSGGSADANTRRWLDAYRIPFSSPTFTADKTVVRVDAAIDDKPGNYDSLDAAGHSRVCGRGRGTKATRLAVSGSWAEFEAVVDCLARAGR